MADGGAIIRKTGAISPVGIGADQTAASVRAGAARFMESSVYGKRFEPLTMALVPEEYLEPLLPELDQQERLTARQRRMLRLAGPALREAVDGCDGTADIPLFLGVPEPFEDRPDPAGEAFPVQLQRQSGIVFDTAGSRLFPAGRAAGLWALKEALDHLNSGSGKRVLVGGVDTYLDLYLLATLDSEERIAGPGVLDGFIPGEGGAFLLLESAGSGSGAAAGPEIAIEGVGTAEEPGHRYADEPHKGEGLPLSIEALSNSLNGEPEPVQTVFAGLNGEQFGAKEWGTAYLRHSALFAEGFRVEHPVDCFGDVGAALGPMMIALAVAGTRGAYLPGPFLVWCSSDREPRACAYIRVSV